jgi:hypothetical protein
MGKASASTPGPTGLLAAALLLVSSLLASNAAAQSQGSTNAEVRSVVFQDPEKDSRTDDGSASSSSAAGPQLHLGIGGSLVFQVPQGNYAADHGSSSAFGYSFQIPIRSRSKQWTFLPTYTRILSSLNSSLDHETKSLGLDVHWRGPNPGAGYLLLGGGSATAQLNVLHTQCASVLIPVTCSQGSSTASSTTAPYGQVGFGVESESGGPSLSGGWFFEARLWRGPYLQPVSLADGTLVGSKARTGNALMMAVGFRLLGSTY